MLRQRNRTFERSYQEIKQKAMPEQTRVIFENLSLLQKSIQHNWSSQKRDSTYKENSNTNTSLEEEHVSPKKWSALQLFQENFSNKIHYNPKAWTTLLDYHFVKLMQIVLIPLHPRKAKKLSFIPCRRESAPYLWKIESMVRNENFTLILLYHIFYLSSSPILGMNWWIVKSLSFLRGRRLSSRI